jgi:hypothetical protein
MPRWFPPSLRLPPGLSLPARAADLPAFIHGCLLTGGALTFALLLVGILWVLLALVGDAAGASGANLAMLLLAVAWCLNFVTLVVLLAADRLKDQNDR